MKYFYTQSKGHLSNNHFPITMNLKKTTTKNKQNNKKTKTKNKTKNKQTKNNKQKKKKKTTTTYYYYYLLQQSLPITANIFAFTGDRRW